MTVSSPTPAAVTSEIETIDREIVRLLGSRARLVQTAARERDGEASPRYRPEEEAEQMRRIGGWNEGPLGHEDVTRIFSEVISSCRALELALTVGFLGPEGTFTEAAALKHFGRAIGTRALGSIDAVFREVESGACDYGVVPVENSTEGMVSHTLDMFLRSDLQICGEVMLPIHHCLISTASSLDEIAKVYSHQQSLAQCRRWLDTHLPRAEREAVSSNAEAARISRLEAGCAAIAGRVAAQAYDVPVLAHNIEDEPDNTTRFLVVGHDRVPATGDDKTSVMFWFRDRPGGLFHAIEAFANRDINMTRIESRPSRLERWTYVFYVDCAGHRDDDGVREALAELRTRTDFLKIVGSFPRAAGEERE